MISLSNVIAMHAFIMSELVEALNIEVCTTVIIVHGAVNFNSYSAHG